MQAHFFRLTEYIDLYNPGDEVLLEALYQLVQVAPEQAQLVLDRLPVEKFFLSSRCRRTVKHLGNLLQRLTRVSFIPP